ncbi:MAG: hypothetical protein OXF56_08815 [Rhodobacteraceae bacterium]|nr:hypothetical protein [Paracoccaceae bacterium]
MAYAILKLGGVPALPFFCLGEAVRGLAGRNSAVMPADHGPAEAGKDIEAAGQGAEEPRETAKLAFRLGGMPARGLSPDPIRGAVTKSDVDWNA